ncbi:MAG: hypothetical protein IJA34_06010 [Lachnospiraceae bacterium]|nr:hypothetical protein [Lachnospiraceae bacterium]
MKAKKISNNQKEKLNIYKAKVIAIIAMISYMAITVVVWAKFVKEEYIKANVFDQNIATYYMDVLGEDQTKTLSEQILVDELNPGETREVEFYVRNGNDSKVSQVDMDYEIELIHTDNMPLTYELYDSEGNLLTGTVLTDNVNLYENDGTRVKYNQSNNNEKFVLHIDKNDETKIDSQKYTLKISWGEDIGTADFKYVKEIDFLYVNVYAYESNPLKS